MTLEKWIIQPGQSRVIDIDDVRKLKIGMVGGQIDVVAHDEPGIRIEVHAVTAKDLRIEASGATVEIDHPQLRWDNFLEVFRNFGSGGPKAEISVAVPREIAITLGVVSASALISGLRSDASVNAETKLNTVSGDIFIDGMEGDVSINAVSGDVQARNFAGALSANSVSGDVAATGRVRKASIDTVSGAMLIDSTGDVHQINLNTVSGRATIRLDDALPANYVVRSVSGRVQIDGTVHSGKGSVPGTNYSGSTGELSNSFVDVRANSVSGEIIVLRRGETTSAGEENDETASEELS